ncbi:beta-galactosidase [Candidatus Uhrbacteria bacterium]|nr:beta-galactosidase [Candidatus Uhrbacteria bacterium]
MHLKKLLFVFVIIIGAIFAIFLFLLNLPGTPANNDTKFGVTFSPAYAESFGVDWRAAYRAILDDLGVRYVRLSAYWNTTEPEDDYFTFDDLDYQLDWAARRKAHVVLGVGRKLPRWPECHDPEWVKGFPAPQFDEKVLDAVRAVVERYKDHPALSRWQVENEVLFPFGRCSRPYNLGLLKKEIDLVRSIDPGHEIVVTDSGEWTVWMPLAFYGDVLGVSMYREAWNDFFNTHIPFPIKEGWYQFRARLISPWRKTIIVTELQTEPWAGKPVESMGPDESMLLMPLDKIKDNVRFARNVGFPEVYLWGVEWWYALREQNLPEIWDGLKDIFGA